MVVSIDLTNLVDANNYAKWITFWPGFSPAQSQQLPETAGQNRFAINDNSYDLEMKIFRLSNHKLSYGNISHHSSSSLPVLLPNICMEAVQLPTAFVFVLRCSRFPQA